MIDDKAFEEARTRRIMAKRKEEVESSVAKSHSPVIKSTDEEQEHMADNGNGGYVGPSDVATLSLLGRGGLGYGGYGGGYGGMPYGNDVLAAGAHADGTAVAAKLEANADKTDAQTDMFEQAERSRQFKDVSDQVVNVAKDLSDEHVVTQQAITTNGAATLAAIADAAKESAKCCCEAQLLATKNASDLKAEILASESRSITRELDRCERKLEGSESTSAIVGALREQTQFLAGLLQQGSHH